ncbi:MULTISPECIES: precorrin-3B C(17)-methyltransferase [Thermoanaerobacterium]|uniref:Precorrin-3B C(17)-methyltransferase n=2 Tax=Thermoanaerobacterium TaxID=28895 RepID=W9ECS6_9THEO|nr:MULTISPECIES: precorrin-3B C(17)-methyltransferase [Thermoanaerobacterium]AFK87634.1 precorrin-3B C17-methyltransferase [Thermoanaerobacterium saccharolyticum JW/SL-YS485]ETO37569.1 precorrin-3B C(17)-methyltransferase [Thermoanaerobacterium aotearoense SCUT27]
MGWVKIVGIGPGSIDDMTFKAYNALRDCDVVVGYVTYIRLIKELIKDKKIVSMGMRKEIERAKIAIQLALDGNNVCVISSGDAGIYGMAGPVYEVALKEKVDLQIEVIPGVSSLNAASSLLGAPLMQDFAVISLSDHLVPWQVIEKRLELASKADFLIVIFNPKSKERTENFYNAQKIIMKYKRGNVPVGIIKNASRENQKIIITTLDEMSNQEIDMQTIVIVGNESTYIRDGKMISPRGYIL